MSNQWEIAYWRFKMISALLDTKLTKAQKGRIIRNRTKRDVQWPNSSGERQISKNTLIRWHKKYRENGFLGLMPKARNDKGLARAVPQKIFNIILELKHNHPNCSYNNINFYLKSHYNLEVKRSTLSRYLKQKSDIIYGSDKNCHFDELCTKLVRDKVGKGCCYP